MIGENQKSAWEALEADQTKKNTQNKKKQTR